VHSDAARHPVMPAPTHRPLPVDPSLEPLDGDVRAGVAAAWRSRARNELSTSTLFASLARSLVAASAPLEIVRAAAAAVEDEVRHAEICVHVARAYLPDGPPPEASRVVEAPEVESGAAPELAAVLFVVSQSCINEGVACAYLQRCLAEAEHPLARAAVRDILEDEIHHARFGWSLLTSPFMRAELRPGVAEALPTLLERIAGAWVAYDPSELPAVPAGHGTIRPDAMATVVREAYEELVLPGFDRVRVDTSAARAWFIGRRGGETR
jgi:hypothetical protein